MPQCGVYRRRSRSAATSTCRASQPASPPPCRNWEDCVGVRVRVRVWACACAWLRPSRAPRRDYSLQCAAEHLASRHGSVTTDYCHSTVGCTQARGHQECHLNRHSECCASCLAWHACCGYVRRACGVEQGALPQVPAWRRPQRQPRQRTQGPPRRLGPHAAPGPEPRVARVWHGMSGAAAAATAAVVTPVCRRFAGLPQGRSRGHLRHGNRA